MKPFAAALAVFVLWITAAPASAQEELQCEHAKLNTNDATPVDPGQWELELAFESARSHTMFTNGWGRGRRALLRDESLGLAVTYGLAPDLDVGVAVGFADVYDRSAEDPSAHGWTDLELAAKWRFYHDEDARLEIAYIPSITIPTGEDEVTDDFFTFFNGAAVSKDWGGPWTSNFDLGLAYAVGGHRGPARWALSADAALGYQLTEGIHPEVELNYSHDFNNGSDADLLAATVGAIICLSDNVRLDIGVQQGLFGRNADQSTALQAALVFGF